MRRTATFVDGILYIDEASETDIEFHVSAHKGIIFADGDTSPSVSGGFSFATANTSATIITNFDNPKYDGDSIEVYFGDALTTLQNSSVLNLPGGVDITPQQFDIMRFTYWYGVWYGMVERSS